LRIADNESVRGKHACLIMTYEPPVSERLHELIVWTDALMSGTLKELTLVLPYFIGSRQDRKTRRGEPINIRSYIHAIDGVADKQVAKLGWMTVDLHAEQCGGITMTFDNFSALPFFARHIKNRYDGNVAVVSPDIGGLIRAANLAKMVGVDVPTCIPKVRSSTGEVSREHGCYDGAVVGGKTAIVIDDMIDTGGTLIQACEGLRGDGATDVAVYATHALLNGNAVQNLREINAQIVTTDTVYHPKENLESLNITCLPISYVVAEAISRQHMGKSTRKLREDDAVDIVARKMPCIRDLLG